MCVMNRIWLASPHMSEEGFEKKYIESAFEKNWITTLGDNVREFEVGLKEYTKAENVLAVSAGTAALHLAIKMAEVKQGDLVFCQDSTFAASVNPAVYEKANVVFIDSDRDTWNLSPEALEKAIEIYGVPKVVIVVHLYGIPAKMKEIMAICEKYGILLIEDAAEALGSEYYNQKCGTFGDFGVLSFNGNKIITTSGGGALLCKRAEDSAHALKLATQAREPFPWYEHEEIGYNYRLSNICAGIGCGQLKVLEQRAQQKRNIQEMYKEKLADLPITFMPEPEGTMCNNWLSVILLDELCDVTPNQLIDVLAEENIEARNFWKPMHMQPVFKDAGYVRVEEKSVSEELFDRGVCLPSDTKMTEEDMDRVCKIIKDVLGGNEKEA